MKATLAYLWRRLAEPSTWAALAAFCASLSTGFAGQGWIRAAGVLAGLGVIGGVVGVAVKETEGKPPPG